jgi:hypothetical protein
MKVVIRIFSPGELNPDKRFLRKKANFIRRFKGGVVGKANPSQFRRAGGAAARHGRLL